MTDGHYGYKMDIWGVGCVFFEVLSLYPLFPGENELDQIHKIHNILGTPPQELLDKFQKNATHMKLEFTPKKFVGIQKLIPHASADAQDIILKMLIYNSDDRYTASQCLKHPFFKELRD
jgi:renal tumor antigen